MTTSKKQALARELNWKKAQINNAADLLKRQTRGTAAHLAVENARDNALLNLQVDADLAGIEGNYFELLPFEKTRLGKKHLKEEEQYKKEQAKNDTPF